MSDRVRSEQACPVCGQHTLALDEPPRIDVMGIQLYSDIVGMGDLRQGGPVGIVCLDCGTRWRDKAAFDRNDPEPEVDDADEDVDVPSEDTDTAEDGLDEDPGNGD
jgi:hypothetical protein